MTRAATEHGHGARVLRSGLWMFLNSGLVRALSFATQLVLAALLSKHDFGVYAAAMAVSAFLTTLRDGGMSQWLTQGGRDEFERRAGDAFWTGLAFNLVVGALLASLALPAAAFFGERQIATVVLVAALAFPLTSFGSFYRTLLAIDLRMREVTIIEVASAVVKYALIVWLAFQGWGALSFVMPLPVAYLLEAVLGYAVTRDRPWLRRSAPRRWPALLLGNRWILAGTFVATIALHVDYMIVGRLAPLTVLGVYYFAYQLTYMSASLVTENARRVLFPGLVAVAAAERGAATLKASAVATMIGAPLLVLPAAVIGPVEELLWSGKWEQAVLPLVVLSLGLPIHLMTAITQAILQSLGRFRLWSGVNAIRAVAVSMGATIGALTHPESPLWISAYIAAGLLLANAAQVTMAYRASAVALGHVARTTAVPVVLTPVALVATLVAFDALAIHPLLAAVLQAAAFAALWLAGTLLLARRQLLDSLDFVRRSVRPADPAT